MSSVDFPAHQFDTSDDVARRQPTSPIASDGARGRAVVIAGPSGVGKGTLIAQVRERLADTFYSVSATTRTPRPGEEDGVHYHFWDREDFEEAIRDGRMLEWAVVHGRDYYGTPAGPVLEALNAGRTVILELDLQGARQLRTSLPEATQIFITPPTWEDLRARLEHRGTEDEERIERRLRTAREELDASGEFDVLIVNDSVSRATDELISIIDQSE